MKMILKLLIVCILCLLTVGILYFAVIFIYSFITEFKPSQIEDIAVDKSGIQTVPTEKEFSLLTWNTGYGGLGKEMDFFYEGGRMVRPDESLSKHYIQGIIGILEKQDSLDFILLQEVDFNSKRSYYTDQSLMISTVLADYNILPAINYFSKYISH